MTVKITATDIQRCIGNDTATRLFRQRFPHGINEPQTTALGLELLKAGFGPYLGALVTGGFLEPLDLVGTNLSSMWLEYSVFTGATLTDATLDDANLENVWLINVKLNGASLRRVSLKGSTIYGTDFSGADLRGTQFRGVCFGSGNIWTNAKYDDNTYFGQWLDPHHTGMVCWNHGTA